MSSSSSSGDEDALALVNLLNINNSYRRKKRFWVHPYWRDNMHQKGAFRAFKELNMFPERFQSFYRMRPETFRLLVEKLTPAILKKDTNYRASVTPEERLLITLR